MHMSANHPDFRLDLPTDTTSEVGRAKYDRRALHILIEFKEFGSTRTVDQISAGRTASRLHANRRAARTSESVCKDELNHSADL